MNEDFVTYELAIKLKEKGFTKETAHHYNDKGEICVSLVDEEYPYPCPTISQVLKWLREEKKIYLEIGLTYTGFHCTVYRDVVWDMIGGEDELTYKYHIDVYSNSKTAEQAALAGIEYVLDNLI